MDTGPYVTWLENTLSDQQHKRLWFVLHTQDQWYNIIRECRSWFGDNWKGQAKVKKKFGQRYRYQPVVVWFEIPDERFATWCSVKYSVEVHGYYKQKSNK